MMWNKWRDNPTKLIRTVTPQNIFVTFRLLPTNLLHSMMEALKLSTHKLSPGTTTCSSSVFCADVQKACENCIDLDFLQRSSPFQHGERLETTDSCATLVVNSMCFVACCVTEVMNASGRTAVGRNKTQAHNSTKRTTKRAGKIVAVSDKTLCIMIILFLDGREMNVSPTLWTPVARSSLTDFVLCVFAKRQNIRISPVVSMIQHGIHWWDQVWDTTSLFLVTLVGSAFWWFARTTVELPTTRCTSPSKPKECDSNSEFWLWFVKCQIQLVTRSYRSNLAVWQNSICKPGENHGCVGKQLYLNWDLRDCVLFSLWICSSFCLYYCSRYQALIRTFSLRESDKS